MKKKIIITGGSSGIGKFITKKILSENFYVINLTRKKLNIKSKFYENIIVKDLTSTTEVDKVFKLIKKRHKKIYALINNAGATFPGYNLENFKKNIEINLITVFYLSKKVTEIIEKYGKIINISSIASKVALPNNPGYNASKSAVNSITRSFAFDFYKKKINVNSLILGYFQTKMTKKSFLNKRKKKIINKNNILGRWGRLNEIWGPIKFLLNKDSNYITGQTLNIDGGWTIKGLK